MSEPVAPLAAEAAPEPVLAAEPLIGVEAMRGRGATGPDRALLAGPGKLCKALGLDLDVLAMTVATAVEDENAAPLTAQTTVVVNGGGPDIRCTDPPDGAMVDLAHRENLKVIPYTLRADQMPKFVDDFEQLHDLLLQRANVDGAFTDFPDRMARFLNRR